MEVAASARGHGIPDIDILHAWRNVLRVAEQDDGGESRVIAVGPAMSGALLELVLVPADEPTRVIHADHARHSFLDPNEVMTMPRTHTEATAAEEAEATEKWLDDLDPAELDFRDASHVRAIVTAVEALSAAEENLRGAVAEARAAGDSWSVIGAALGTSRQAAHERFRGLVHR